MVETEWWQLHIVNPLSGMQGVFGFVLFHIGQSEVNNGNDTLSRIAVYFSKSTQLAHEDVLNTSKFCKDSLCCFVDTFIFLDKTSNQRVFALTRIVRTLVYQNF